MHARGTLLVFAMFFFSALGLLAGDTPICAALTFDQKPGVTVEEAAELSQSIARELYAQDEYQVLTRAHVEYHLLQGNFPRTHSVSSREWAARAGEVLGADFVLYGVLEKKDGGYELTAHRVDVETGKIVADAAASTADMDRESITAMVADIALQLAGSTRSAEPPSVEASGNGEKSWFGRNWPWVGGGVVLAGGGMAAFSGSSGGNGGPSVVGHWRASQGVWAPADELYVFEKDGTVRATNHAATRALGTWTKSGSTISFTLDWEYGRRRTTTATLSGDSMSGNFVSSSSSHPSGSWGAARI